MAKVKIQKIPYGGWKNCVQITNDLVDLIVTSDIGPRIIRYGFIGQANEFCEIESARGLTAGRPVEDLRGSSSMAQPGR